MGERWRSLPCGYLRLKEAVNLACAGQLTTVWPQQQRLKDEEDSSSAFRMRAVERKSCVCVCVCVCAEMRVQGVAGTLVVFWTWSVLTLCPSLSINHDCLISLVHTFTLYLLLSSTCTEPCSSLTRPYLCLLGMQRVQLLAAWAALWLSAIRMLQTLFPSGARIDRNSCLNIPF